MRRSTSHRERTSSSRSRTGSRPRAARRSSGPPGRSPRPRRSRRTATASCSRHLRSIPARRTACRSGPTCARRRRTSRPARSSTSRRAATAPRAAAPTLVAVNGGDPSAARVVPADARHARRSACVFSEPLDPRTRRARRRRDRARRRARARPSPRSSLAMASTSRSIRRRPRPPARPTQLRVGAGLVDLGGQPVAATSVTLTPRDTSGTVGPIAQVLRTRGDGDPGQDARAPAPTANVDRRSTSR